MNTYMCIYIYIFFFHFPSFLNLLQHHYNLISFKYEFIYFIFLCFRIVGRAAFTGKHQWILSENYTRDAHPPEVMTSIHGVLCCLKYHIFFSCSFLSMLGHWLADEKFMFLLILYMRRNDKIFMAFYIYFSFLKD